MVVSQKVLDSLRDIGLNLYERKLFVALLARGTSTAGELAEIANVPRSRSYDVLESLAAKGFLVAQNAKPLRYVAVDPKDALDRASQKMRDDMEITMKKIEQLKNSDVLKEMTDLYNHGVKLVEPSEITGSVRGRHSVFQHVGTMIKGAKSNIQIITTAQGLKDLHINHYDSLKAAKDSGISIKIAAHNKADGDAFKALSQVAEVKKLSSPAGRVFIVDNKQSLVALTDDTEHQSQDLAFWTKSEHASAGVLGNYFNFLWNSAE
ncbi:MAG: TrmB family transcriptional regulator [Candidatus Aenigmarchaeota archaeon]|nr:TrmB family transcriptional regulator [Candidatus Aenigmarchaeota archaeon]